MVGHHRHAASLRLHHLRSVCATFKPPLKPSAQDGGQGAVDTNTSQDRCSPPSPMADDEGKLLDAARKAPWGERLTHKNWKARVEAYADVAKFASTSFDAAHPALKEFGA